MNIEIANRLQKLRKEKGFSQEELADALGISRQAVSKWERAEASPDTDNLICLAKLYNVSLDSLLDTDETIEELKEEQKEKLAEENAKDGTFIKDEDGDSIHIGSDGVHLKDADGSEVHICKGHVRGVDKDGHVFVRNSKPRFSACLEGILMLCAVAAFLLIGFLADGFAWSWIVFFIPEIICSIIRCFERKRLGKFNVPVMCTFIYFLVCLALDFQCWHPMWVIFLLVPIYYAIVNPIDYKLRQSYPHSDSCGCCEDGHCEANND